MFHFAARVSFSCTLKAFCLPPLFQEIHENKHQRQQLKKAG
jgi:hypothetical protein